MRIAVLLTFCLAVPAIFVAGCSSGDGGTKLRVEDLEYHLLPGGARIVSGTVHNDGDAPVGAAQVQISLFDENNRRVDGMYAVVRDVPPGGSVSFREPVQSELPINGARVKSIVILN